MLPLWVPWSLHFFSIIVDTCYMLYPEAPLFQTSQPTFSSMKMDQTQTWVLEFLSSTHQLIYTEIKYPHSYYKPPLLLWNSFLFQQFLYSHLLGLARKCLFNVFLFLPCGILFCIFYDKVSEMHQRKWMSLIERIFANRKIKKQSL